MQRLVSRLEKIELNLRKLLRKLHQLEDENTSLKKAIADLKYKLEKANEKLEINLEQNGARDHDWKGEFDEQISKYIFEIDECIKLLKQESFGK